MDIDTIFNIISISCQFITGLYLIYKLYPLLNAMVSSSCLSCASSYMNKVTPSSSTSKQHHQITIPKKQLCSVVLSIVGMFGIGFFNLFIVIQVDGLYVGKFISLVIFYICLLSKYHQVIWFWLEQHPSSQQNIGSCRVRRRFFVASYATFMMIQAAIIINALLSTVDTWYVLALGLENVLIAVTAYFCIIVATVEICSVVSLLKEFDDKDNETVAVLRKLQRFLLYQIICTIIDIITGASASFLINYIVAFSITKVINTIGIIGMDISIYWLFEDSFIQYTRHMLKRAPSGSLTSNHRTTSKDITGVNNTNHNRKGHTSNTKVMILQPLSRNSKIGNSTTNIIITPNTPTTGSLPETTLLNIIPTTPTDNNITYSQNANTTVLIKKENNTKHKPMLHIIT